MNRKDYKQMYVWDDDRPVSPITAIIIWYDPTTCIAVSKGWEKAFLKGNFFYTLVWEHCEEIPETEKVTHRGDNKE